MVFEWSQAVTVLNFCLLLGVAVASTIAFRSGRGKAEQEIAQNTILALQAENALLHSKITRMQQDIDFLEQEVKRLEREIRQLTAVSTPPTPTTMTMKNP
jgi:septal ring factor EnvC (AmiA/AmiB activator)